MPSRKSGLCVVKKCLTQFSHAWTEKTCPSREGQHKAFLHHKPCGGTAPWERALERNGAAELARHRRLGLWWEHSSGHLSFSLQEPLRMGPRCRGFGVLRELSEFLPCDSERRKYFRQKDKRNNHHGQLYVCLSSWPTMEEASAVPAGVAFELSLVPHPSLHSQPRFFSEVGQ